MIRTTSRSLRWCARGRFGRSGAPGFCPRSRRREIGGRAQAAPVVRGRPERPVRGGGGSCGTEVAESLLVLVSWGVQAAQVFTGVGGVAGHMHPAGGVASGDQFGRLAGMGDLAGAVGSSHSGQDRQADRAGQERQLRDDSGYDPAGTEPEGFRSFRRTVVVPGRTEHFLPGRVNSVSSDTPGSMDTQLPAGRQPATTRDREKCETRCATSTERSLMWVELFDVVLCER
jgi:hypothetical protein